MLITPAVLQALQTDFSLTFETAYNSAQVWIDQVATTIPSSTKSNTYGWVEKAIKLREWIGPREALNLKAQKYVLENKKFEATLEVDRDDIEDDNLGLYKAAYVPQFGEAVRKHPQELVAEMIIANTALAWDGLPLFDNSHVIGTSSYDNLDSLSLTADNFETIYNKMVAINDETGRSLQVRPTLLMHAPQLRRKALEILNATSYAKVFGSNAAAAEQPNVMAGWCATLEVPEWGAAATTWALLDTSKPIKPFVNQTRRPFAFVARDNPQDPKVFDLAKFTYGTDGRMNIGITLPWLISLGHA